jgi:integrase
MTKKFTQNDKKKLELTRLNTKTKNYSLNPSLTNPFSLKRLDDLLLGKAEAKQSQYKEDVEALLENLAIQLNAPKRLGPEAIATTLMSQANLTSIPILNYVKSKQRLSPYAFLNHLDVMMELEGAANLLTNQTSINREHFKDLNIYQYLIEATTQPCFVIKVLLEFHKRWIDPFYEKSGEPLWIAPKREVVNFHHPAYKAYMTQLLRERISPKSEPYYHQIFKRFFRWVTQVYVEFQPYDLNNVPVYKIKAHHLQDYKRYLLVQVKAKQRSKNKASDDLYFIRDFFEQLYINKRILQDITQHLTMIKQNRYKYRDIPNKQEIKRFFEIIYTYSEEPLKMGLAFGFLFYNGLRIDEMTKLKWKNLNFSRHTLSLKRKGDKSCIIYIPSPLYDSLKELHSHCERDPVYLFDAKPSRFKVKINQAYKVFARLADWKFPNGVHLFRHVFITYLTNQKSCTPDKLKELADVENLETLSYYIHRSDTSLTKEINKMNLDL